MDHARKIGKTDEHRKWERRATSCMRITDNPISTDEPIKEDRRLINWKKWLADRQKQYDRSKSVTKRDQTEQIMNSCETLRPLNEMKNLMDHANVPVPVVPDKYRGGPEFWRTPEYLPNRNNPCLPEIAITPSRKDRNVSPDLMYVGLPDLILKEKSLVGLKSAAAKWHSVAYLKMRKRQLAHEIKLLVPREPDTQKLVVEGRSFRQRKPAVRTCPITVTEPEESEEATRTELAKAVIFKIQDTEIAREENLLGTNEDHPGPIVWSLTFSGVVGRKTEETITFENKGTRVILYTWRDASRQSNIMNVEARVSPFFFDKTNGVVLPGQIVRSRIWYQARTPGISTESWRLVTSPTLCCSPLIFRLWGCSEASEIVPDKLDPRSIDTYLDLRVRNVAVREIIDEIMANVDHTKPPEPTYASLFLEGDIFRAKNPFYFYHPSIVVALRNLYRGVANFSAPPWNLSLECLREILLQINEIRYKNEMLMEFNKLCNECLKPTLCSPMKDSKQQMVYNTLCSFANIFEVESEHVVTACIVRKNDSECGIITLWESGTMRSSTTSQSSTKSNNSRRQFKRHSGKMQTKQWQGNVDKNVANKRQQIYKEVFFIRVREILTDAIDHICAIIDSMNRLNEGDK